MALPTVWLCCTRLLRAMEPQDPNVPWIITIYLSSFPIYTLLLRLGLESPKFPRNLVDSSSWSSNPWKVPGESWAKEMLWITLQLCLTFFFLMCLKLKKPLSVSYRFFGSWSASLRNSNYGSNLVRATSPVLASCCGDSCLFVLSMESKRYV